MTIVTWSKKINIYFDYIANTTQKVKCNRSLIVQYQPNV